MHTQITPVHGEGRGPVGTGCDSNCRMIRLSNEVINYVDRFCIRRHREFRKQY